MSQSVSFVVAAKAFGRISRRALEAPVTIMHRGQESLVLMSHAEYRRLTTRQGEEGALDELAGGIGRQDRAG
jgi:PHD/YefM family antitoxin component YafN of YafNO toxin-antitoxin module